MMSSSTYMTTAVHTDRTLINHFFFSFWRFFRWRSLSYRGKMELNAYVHSNSAFTCACLHMWTITFSFRFIDRPEQRLSLDDLKGFLLESQKVTLRRYMSSSLQNFPLQCPLNPCLCINPGNVGHGQQQGPGIHVQLPERPPERSRAALFPPRWGTSPLRTLPPLLQFFLYYVLVEKMCSCLLQVMFSD